MDMNDEVLCYDLLSCRFFKSSLTNIQRAINEINRRRIEKLDHRTRLNEWYEVLDLPYMPSIDVARILGWESYEESYRLIDVKTWIELTDENQPCVMIQLTPNPVYL